MTASSDTGKILEKEHIASFRRAILSWYDRHRRVLPWRALPDTVSSPYHVWLSEIMLQQTVVAAVIPYFQKFVEKWPTVHDLAAAPAEDVMQAWAGLGYYARARNLHKCAQVISSQLNGRFPDTLKELKKLPGVGDYTSAAITAIAFNKPATVVDGNVERVLSRYFAVTEPLPDSKPILKKYADALAEGRADRPGDFAQALMDLGATICIPKAPRCILCPLHDRCAGRKKEIAAELPRKKAKAAKPAKKGYVYWVVNGAGQVLLEKRPEKGMLGNMPGLPTSPWIEKSQKALHDEFLMRFDLKKAKGFKVFHSFTHFDLTLEGEIISSDIDISQAGKTYFWSNKADLEVIGFPTLFKKSVNLFLSL